MRRVRGVARQQFTSQTMVISDMQDTAQGIRVVKAFNLEPAMRTRMAASIESLRERADKIVRITARSSPQMEVLGGLAIAVIVLWAGYQTIYQGVQPGALMSFIAAIALAYEPAEAAGAHADRARGRAGGRPPHVRAARHEVFHGAERGTGPRSRFQRAASRSPGWIRIPRRRSAFPGLQFHGRGRQDHRAGRSVGIGQEHDHLADRALL
ncbi:MAG: ABC transporter transmembrane domain-containing protein [Bauldia sp.]